MAAAKPCDLSLRHAFPATVLDILKKRIVTCIAYFRCMAEPVLSALREISSHSGLNTNAAFLAFQTFILNEIRNNRELIGAPIGAKAITFSSGSPVSSMTHLQNPHVKARNKRQGFCLHCSVV